MANFRQQAPQDAAAQHKEDAVHDIPHRPQSRPPERAGCGQQRGDDVPFRVGQIG